MALVLLNPHARGGRAARLQQPLAQWLDAHRPEARLVVAPSVAAARQAIVDVPPGTRVVVVGGDGTLHHLLPALQQQQAELALVPAGSGDDTARALGLRGMPWPRALAHGLQAPARPIDLGEVRTEHESRPFVSSLAAGFDAAVAQRALAGPRALEGLPRYLWATLREVAALRPHAVHVQVDGQTVHDGALLFASTLNTGSYGGGMPAAPPARIDDGRLDLLLAGRFGRAGVLAMLPRLLLGRHLGHPRVRLVCVERLRLDSAQPLPLAADGEPMRPACRVEVRVLPAALRAVVLAPGRPA